MTPEEFKEAVEKIIAEHPAKDKETIHIRTDALCRNLLKDLGYGEGAEIISGLKLWYS